MSSKRSRPYDDPPSPESSEEEEEEEEEQTPIQNPKKPQSNEEEEEEEEEVEEEEEEEEEVEEEEEEEEEEETDADLMKKSTNKNNTKVSQPEPESEAGSGSESEAEPETNYIAKPIVKESSSSKAKKVPKTTSSKEEKLKKATKPSPKPQGSSGGGEDDEDGGEKKALFARVWSNDDELAVLQGMIDFKKGNGKDPLSNSDEFYNFVKQKISNGKFTKSQIVDKVRRLKKKYLTCVAKSNNGKAVEFSDPHLLKGYKLSEVIWGKNDGNNAAIVNSKVKISSNSTNAKKDNSPAATIGVVALPASDNENVGSVVKGGRSAKKPKISDGNRGFEVKNGNVGKVENKVEVEGEGGVVVKGFTELYPHLMEVYDGECVSGLDGLKNYLGKVDGVVLEEWNKKWGEIRVAEMEMYVKKLALIQEQVSVLSNAIKSSQS